MPSEIHLDDYGTRFIFTIYDEDTAIYDISAADSFALIFVDPNNIKKTKIPSLYTDGTDGKIQYIIASGDLDTIGTWRYQVIVYEDSARYYSDIGTFKVNENL